MKRFTTHSRFFVFCALFVAINTAPAPSQQRNYEHYLLLQKGNWWQYTPISPTPERETIVDTVTLDENVFYKFDRLRTQADVYCVFVDGTKLILREGSVDVVWLDFAAEVGESWLINHPLVGPGKMTLESKTDTVTVPYGTFTDVYRFYYEGGVDNALREYYAPYVGCIKREFYWLAGFKTELIEASLSVKNMVHPFFALYQNYPNPAIGETVVAYELYRPASAVQLTLTDVLGREIHSQSLGDGEMGKHTFPLHLEGLASGVYRYTLSVNGVSQTRLLQILR